MNEIQLSDSLPIIETEIRQYQNLAGESIFEIGRRLKHVKENDLAHGEFGKWLKSINLNDSQARKFVKVFDENLNRSMSNTLGLEALYQISTLPESERNKEHTTSKGEVKTPDEMTVRELRELKKQLKQQEQQNATLQQQLEQAENKEPEVIERYSVPDDYEEMKEKLSELHIERADLRSRLHNLHMTEKEREEKSRKYDELNEAINAMDMKLSDDQLRFKNRKFVNDLLMQSRILMRDVTPLIYTIDSLHEDDLNQMNDSLENLAKELYKISSDIKKQLNRGVVINE